MKTLNPLLVNGKSGCIDVRLITLSSNPRYFIRKTIDRRPASIVLVVMVLYGSESSHRGVNFGKSTRKLFLQSAYTLQRLYLCGERNERGVPMSNSRN